jgi:hypothetical protein
MQLQAKRWNLLPPAPASHMARLSHIAPLIAQVLYNRGVVDPRDVDAFLQGESRLDNPFRLKDMPEAVTRIRQALRDG